MRIGNGQVPMESAFARPKRKLSPPRRGMGNKKGWDEIDFCRQKRTQQRVRILDGETSKTYAPKVVVGERRMKKERMKRKDGRASKGTFYSI